MYGTLSSSWELKDGKMTLSLEIPPRAQWLPGTGGIIHFLSLIFFIIIVIFYF